MGLKEDYAEIYRRFDPDGELAVHIEFETDGTDEQITANIKEILEMVITNDPDNLCLDCEYLIRGKLSFCKDCPVKDLFCRYGYAEQWNRGGD